MAVDALLREVAANQPYPVLFATVSGAHLQGFPRAGTTLSDLLARLRLSTL